MFPRPTRTLTKYIDSHLLLLGVPEAYSYTDYVYRLSPAVAGVPEAYSYTDYVYRLSPAVAGVPEAADLVRVEHDDHAHGELGDNGENHEEAVADEKALYSGMPGGGGP